MKGPKAVPHNTPEKRRAYLAATKARRVAKYKVWYANPANRAKKAANYRAWYAQPEKRAKRLAYGAVRHKNNPSRTLEAKNRKQESVAGRPRPNECEACGGNYGGKGNGIMFDHCHNSGQFRGWLCHNCNVALGLLADDRDRLRKLIVYLDRTSVNTSPQLALSGI
jgi:hypothetical protein